MPVMKTLYNYCPLCLEQIDVAKNYKMELATKGVCDECYSQRGEQQIPENLPFKIEDAIYLPLWWLLCVFTFPADKMLRNKHPETSAGCAYLMVAAQFWFVAILVVGVICSIVGVATR